MNRAIFLGAHAERFGHTQKRDRAKTSGVQVWVNPRGVPIVRRDSEARVRRSGRSRAGLQEVVTRARSVLHRSRIARQALQPREDDRLQRDPTIGEAVVGLHGCILERSGAVFSQRRRQSVHVRAVLIVGCHDQQRTAAQGAGPAQVIPSGRMPRGLGEQLRRCNAEDRGAAASRRNRTAAAVSSIADENENAPPAPHIPR